MDSVQWNNAAFAQLAKCDAVRAEVERVTTQLCAQANARAKPAQQGKKANRSNKPVYACDVKNFQGATVGLIHPANESAILDQNQNHTLNKIIH